MNLKPVELQIALSRTADAGAQQKNAMDKPMIEQQQLASFGTQQEERTKSRPEEVSASDSAQIRDEQSSKKGKQRSRKRKETKHDAKEQTVWKDPNKGQHIDFTL